MVIILKTSSSQSTWEDGGWQIPLEIGRITVARIFATCHKQYYPFKSTLVLPFLYWIAALFHRTSSTCLWHRLVILRVLPYLCSQLLCKGVSEVFCGLRIMILNAENFKQIDQCSCCLFSWGRCSIKEVSRKRKQKTRPSAILYSGSGSSWSSDLVRGGNWPFAWNESSGESPPDLPAATFPNMQI